MKKLDFKAYEHPWPDDGFHLRSDAFLKFSLQQIDDKTNTLQVNYSLVFAAARMQASVCVHAAETSQELKDTREEILNYYAREYRTMLDENLKLAINNFDEHTAYKIKPGEKH